MNKRFFFFVLLFFAIISHSVQGQQNNTLYFMHGIPQVSLLNPAYMDTCKLFIGLPVLSSFHLAMGNTALSYNVLVPKNDAGERQLDPDYTLSKMHTIDYVFLELHTNLLSVGYRWQDYYFMFNMAEKINFDLGFPKDLFSLVWNGNTQYIESPAKFDRLGVNFNHYREYSLSAAKKMNKELQLGVRGKLMFGKMQVGNRRSKIRFTVDEENYYLGLSSNVLINSSVPGLSLGSTLDDVSFDAGGLSALGYLFNRKNWGVGFDLGGIYNYEDWFTYHASLQDLGFIRFRSNINKIEQTNDFEYTGPQDVEFQNYFESIGDSIINSYLQNQGNNNPYMYFLPPKLYLGATYKFRPKIEFGIVSSTKYFQRRIIPSLTLSANTQPFRFLSFTLSYSYMNNNFNNIGMGLSLRGKHTQFYLLTDNFSSAIWPLSARGFNMRFGFNMFFGCGRAECPKDIGCGWVKEAMYKKQKMDLRKKGKDLRLKDKKRKKKCKS